MFSQASVKNSVTRGEGGAHTPRDSKMATAVDGTHPTGMHSSYFNCFITTSFIIVGSVS